MPWPLRRWFASESSVGVRSSTGPASSYGSASSGNEFSVRLFRELLLASPTSNVFFSPCSVMLCMAMVREVASGRTREEIGEALGLARLSPEEARLALVTLKGGLRDRDGLQVRVANSLWTGLHTSIAEECIRGLRADFGADVTQLDMSSAAAPDRINSWVRDKTKGQINHLLDQLSPLTALVAVNAIYFKGLWQDPFPRMFTRDQPFTTSAGLKKQLPTMHQSGEYRYYEDRHLQLAAIPYRGQMAMYVALPAQGTRPEEFQRKLDVDTWQRWMAKLDQVPGTIQIPRFKLDYQAGMVDELKTMGMQRVFDPAKAEFEGVRTTHPPVWLDQVIHRAVVEVNEEGTEAAAASAAMMRCASAKWTPPTRRFQMNVDRPFLAAIRDEQTGTVLFMGWVEDPE